MTDKEAEHAGAYYFDLGAEAPDIDVDVDDELFVSYNYGLDVAPQGYRNLHDEE